MRILATLLAAVLMCCLAASASFALPSYSGSLSGPSALGGTGFWVNDPNDPASYPGWFTADISWTIAQQPSGYWNYNYVLNVYRAEVSHFILETSPAFGREDMSGETGAFQSLVFGTHGPSAGNPSIPGSAYGVKFDGTSGTTLTLNFNSYRQPVWGDFYAKCGAVGGTQNTVWNLGFGTPDTDPTAGPSSGSLSNHILVPDTVVPEPSSVMALGTGLLGLVGLVRRRRA